MKQLIVGAAAVSALIVGALTTGTGAHRGGDGDRRRPGRGLLQGRAGGKSEARFERPCTEALDTEQLSPRDKAGTYVNRGVLRLRRLEWGNAVQGLQCRHPTSSRRWASLCEPRAARSATTAMRRACPT